jgi:hypothetical protein
MYSHTVRALYTSFNKVGKEIDEQECACFFLSAREATPRP